MAEATPRAVLWRLRLVATIQGLAPTPWARRRRQVGLRWLKPQDYVLARALEIAPREKRRGSSAHADRQRAVLVPTQAYAIELVRAPVPSELAFDFDPVVGVRVRLVLRHFGHR